MQNKNYNLSGRLTRLLRPYYQIKNIKTTTEFEFNGFKLNLTVEKNYKYNHFLIALDSYKNGVFQDELGISVEGHKTWKENLDIFIQLVKDNYKEITND